MPDGIMVASACAALSPGQKPAIIHCPLRLARARGGESGTDDFLPALRALLLPGTALSTPVDVGADGSDGYCRVPAIAMMHHRG